MPARSRSARWPTYRRDPDGGVIFGMKASVVRTGTVAVRDKVDVLEWRS